jgi:phage-related protein
MIDIEFYDTEEGSCPVQEYLDTLEPKLLAKTLRTIDLLETNGTKLRMPFSEHIKDGIFELRAKQSSDITRIFIFSTWGIQQYLQMVSPKRPEKHPKTKSN